MSDINYETEVKKVYPDAVEHYNDLLKVWFIKSDLLSHVYYGESEDGRSLAWACAYTNLKNKSK